MDKEPPDPVDLHVGKAVKERRMSLGLSQSEIGKVLGLTFQQVQKYEKASNRISASKLYALASVLKVPVYYFFQGLDASAVPGFAEPPADYDVDVEAQRDLREMSRLLSRIDNPAARRQLLDLAKTLVQLSDGKSTT
jgi:transcriptional regulator with XRE-family HTH domain